MYRDISNIVINNDMYIYKKIIVIPDEVIVKIEEGVVVVIGQLGELTHKLNTSVNVHLKDYKCLDIYSNYFNYRIKSLIGTTKSIINGMIVGVSLGFTKKLQLVGIGYRVSIEQNSVFTLNLIVGLSHPVYYKLPAGIKAQCPSQTEIVLTGIDKQLLGQVAADVRSIRPPEPFKGKGIRYENEKVYKKDTKKR